jgi:hypothetical protein
LTSKASEFFKKQTNFSLNTDLPQRKLVDLGRAIGRIVSAGLVIDLAEKGFRKDLIENCLSSLQQDISNLIYSYHNSSTISSVDEYQDGSSWLEFS